MLRKIKALVILALFFIMFSGVTNNYCSAGTEKEKKYTKEFGIFSGCASGTLKRQDDYELIPLYFQFGLDVSNFFEKIHIKTKGSFKFIYEPFLNTIISPDSNIETGCDFVLKYSYPLMQKFSFYLDAGLGMMYSTQHTYEQGTQFNFTEQAGGGIAFYFTENKALNFGYRYRHFSNSDIEEPNKGVDVEFILCGITILY